MFMHQEPVHVSCAIPNAGALPKSARVTRSIESFVVGVLPRSSQPLSWPRHPYAREAMHALAGRPGVTPVLGYNGTLMGSRPLWLSWC